MTQPTKACPFCAETILSAATKCRYCGEFLNGDSRHSTADSSSRDAGVAAVLSFVIPGLGQVYNGQISKGILGFVFCLVGYATIILGLIIHVSLVFDAYATARHGKIPNHLLPWYRRHYYLPWDRRGHDAP